MGRYLKISCYKSKIRMQLQSVYIQKEENWLKEPEIGADTLQDLSKFTSTDKKNCFSRCKVILLEMYRILTKQSSS